MKRCVECGYKSDKWIIKRETRHYSGEGYDFDLFVDQPYCERCGALIFDKELEKTIREKANAIIRKKRGIITKDEIISLTDKYKVSQKYLSRVLGWGEVTLPRYISGNYTPNDENSAKLKAIENPYVLLGIMQKNTDIENDNSYGKLIKNISNAIVEKEEEGGKLYKVVNWFLENADDKDRITNLALQKVLYFAQAWSYVLNGEWLFENDCEAWVHGAVYRDVYNEFRSFGYDYLPKIQMESDLSDKEKELLQFIKKYYLDVYTAKALENICHYEEPYKATRGELGEAEASNEIISKDAIREYYLKIAKKYKIDESRLQNVKKYLNSVEM